MSSPPTPLTPPAVAAHNGVPANGWVGRAIGPPLVSCVIHLVLVFMTAQWWIDGSLPTRTHVLELANVDRQPLVDEPIIVTPRTTHVELSESAASDDSVPQLPILSPVPAPQLTAPTPQAAVSRTGEIQAWVHSLPRGALAGGGSAKAAGAEGDDEGKEGGDGAEFFGVSAGGRRFVFVVDSSRSMSGRRWVLACQELLKTVKSLNGKQSFYVIFFDQGANPMFTKDVQQELLPATSDNVTKLRRWISSISFGHDTRPARALQMALALKPDAVFLLSDGEFRDNTRVMLRVANRRDGDAEQEHVAPIHTIGFHSPAAGLSLQPLAAENGGIYRFVPHPRARSRSTTTTNDQLSQVQR